MDLRGSTFPIIFKICVSPAFDKEALINMGYTKFSHYFQASIISLDFFVLCLHFPAPLSLVILFGSYWFGLF